jgi:hypothetical protein
MASKKFFILITIKTLFSFISAKLIVLTLFASAKKLRENIALTESTAKYFKSPLKIDLA